MAARDTRPDAHGRAALRAAAPARLRTLPTTSRRQLRRLPLAAGATPHRPPEEELFDSDAGVLDWGLRQWIIKEPHLLLKILFDGSVRVSHYATRWQLGPLYHRVQPMLPEDVDLGDASKVPLLLAVADAQDLDDTVAWIGTHWP
jgi:hypothetical protein